MKKSMKKGKESGTYPREG
jgi:hypothetical protein